MKKPYSLNNKKFKSISSSSNAEVSEDTLFEYFELEGIIWASYSGGAVVKGQLLGRRIDDSRIEFAYQHINQHTQILTGHCMTNIVINDEGKFILNEKWKWTSGDFSEGESTLIEL